MEIEELPYLGMWAELRRKYLIAEKPRDYAELVQEHMMIEYLSAV